ALAALATLPVKGRAPMTGYERDEFGHGWIDVDRNGCDTRNDVLARDLVAIDRPAGCRVLSGVLDDPYTGRVIEFVRGEGTSQLVQIDHVVPLANAWATGAQRFTDEERIAFANDPSNLLAVDGATNAQKGAGDAATWLPPDRSFRCEYVARQVEVKARHGLWVTPPERDAIERVLDGCRAAA
ncbi:MAG TPA: HNH endonuclease family protein, partial [Agromyces sp.]|nr:HNH endonuclease family protein [Agromyces sp.]